MNRVLRYLTLPAEISSFERSYLTRMNRIALVFFWLHLPVFIGVALLAGTSPVRAALLTGATLVGPTLAYVSLADRPRLVSCIYAITAMAMGGVLVYVGQGPLQIEMHFYFFVLIALLAVFANPMVIVAAAATAAAHHFLVWLWLPNAVFNYDAAFGTVVVHAAFVVLESVAAVFVARSFFDNVIGLEQIVRARTVQVDQRNRDMALILDNVAQGFVTIDLEGVLGAERSSILDRWFGSPRPGATVFDYLVPGDSHTQGWFELGLSDLRDGLMPPELVIDQLPRQLTVGERTLQLQYRPIGEPVAALLVVVTDITSEMARQRAEASTRELFSAVEKARGDRSGFEAFITESDQLVRRCTTAQAALMSELKRELHTLKGNAGLFGVTSIAEICHDIESMIEEEQRFPDAASTARLESAWRDFHSRIDPLLGLSGERTVVVAYQEYRSLLAQVPSPEPRWVEQLRRWGLDATRPHLERFAEQARGLAERLGKPGLQVTVEDGDVRIEGERFGKLWSALVHAVRNAVDHGLEAPDARADAGKPAAGRLLLASRIVDDTLHVEVRDDGRGIDWARVRAAAERRGLPATTPDDLVAALFTGGLSTADAVTDVSGRGIGLDALRVACRELGGDATVRSAPGQGTHLCCSIPLAAAAPRRPQSTRIAALPLVPAN